MKDLTTTYPKTTIFPRIFKSIINNQEVDCVDARELHAKIGLNPANYAKWIRTNVLESPFALDYDYIASNYEKSNKYDLTVTLNTSKHLAMMADTPAGMNIRQYFIDFELTAIAKFKEYIAQLKTQPKLPSHKSHYTIREFVEFKGMSNMPAFDTRKIAYKLTKLCKDNDLEIQHKDSKKFDTINRYPFEVLVTHFAK